MKNLPAPLAFFIVIALALIVAVVSDNSRNKDIYSECQSDFKKNPYSFSKDRLVECNFLNTISVIFSQNITIKEQL